MKVPLTLSVIKRNTVDNGVLHISDVNRSICIFCIFCIHCQAATPSTISQVWKGLGPAGPAKDSGETL